MSAKQFEKQSGYELWHRRLAHASNRNRRDTIKCAIGLEPLNHAIVFVDAATGYRWLYGMKTKDNAIKALRTWYADIADLRTKHKLVVLMRDNASEY